MISVRPPVRPRKPLTANRGLLLLLLLLLPPPLADDEEEDEKGKMENFYHGPIRKQTFRFLAELVFPTQSFVSSFSARPVPSSFVHNRRTTNDKCWIQRFWDSSPFGTLRIESESLAIGSFEFEFKLRIPEESEIYRHLSSSLFRNESRRIPNYENYFMTKTLVPTPSVPK